MIDEEEIDEDFAEHGGHEQDAPAPMVKGFEEMYRIENEAYCALSPEELFHEETNGTQDDSMEPDIVPLRRFKQTPAGHSRKRLNRWADLINDHFDDILDDLVPQGYYGGKGRPSLKLRFHEVSTKKVLKPWRLPIKEKNDRFDFDSVTIYV